MSRDYRAMLDSGELAPTEAGALLLDDQISALERMQSNREVSGDGWQLEASAYRAAATALRMMDSSIAHQLAYESFLESEKACV